MIEQEGHVECLGKDECDQGLCGEESRICRECETVQDCLGYSHCHPIHGYCARCISTSSCETDEYCSVTNWECTSF